MPLASRDERVISWNRSLDAEVQRSLREQETAADEFGRGLRPDKWVAFDENQADWEQFYKDETIAYRYADAWTRPAPSAPYDNLYRENRIRAVRARTDEIRSLRNMVPGTGDPERLAREKSALLVDLVEAKYRVTAWTHELYRHRIVRSNAVWDRYYESSMRLFRLLCGDDALRAAELEIALLSSRRDVVFMQMNALLRLKTEPED